MPTLYTDTATLQNAPGSASEKMAGEQVGGRVRTARFKVTPGTEAAGTIINLVKLPKGARVLPQSALYLEAGQTATLKIAVGDAANAARYYPATATGASAVTIPLAAQAAAPVALAAEGWIFITTSVEALAAKYIAGEILYVID